MRRDALYFLFIYALAFLAGFFYGAHYEASMLGNRAMVYAAAVLPQGGGTLAEVWAEIKPGSGHVYITVTPKAELDTQESAEIAVDVAKRLAGKPLLLHDIAFTINSDSVIVGGPSAGAAMTIAAYAALTGKEPRKDVVITGEILPDGRIGPVGGLVDKLEACAEGGIKYFLIPKGQRYVYVAKPVTRRVSPAPGVIVVEQTIKRETIDLYELGEKMGVQVVEVGRIEEALPYFFS